MRLFIVCRRGFESGIFSGLHFTAALLTKIHYQLLLKFSVLIPVQSLVAISITTNAIAFAIHLANALTWAGDLKEFTLIYHGEN